MSCPGACRVAGRSLDRAGSEAPDDPRRAVRAVLCWGNGKVRRKLLAMEHATPVPPVWHPATVCAVHHARRVLAIEVEPEWLLRSSSTLAH